MKTKKTLRAALASMAGICLALTGCSNTGSSNGEAATEDSGAPSAASTVDTDFDLEELIAAAKKEGPITIYDNASAVEDMAEAFTAKYGIEATGVKVNAAEAFEMVTREAQAGNVQGDVVAIQDVPALTNDLLPSGHVYSWIPGDLVDDIEPAQRDPLIMINDPNFWTYNTEVYDSCPVSNVWELTEEDWKGKVAMEDPEGANKMLDWFSQMSQFGETEMRDAYKEHFGKEFAGESATEEWVGKLAANSPILTDSNENVSAAVGAPGQSEPPVGLMASSKYRNIEEKGYHMGTCDNLKPWAGLAAPKAIVIASGTKNPNAAKLFVHFALTEEGIDPQISDGKYSSNTAITQPEDPSGAAAMRSKIFFFDNAGATEDWDSRVEWTDLWRVNNK
ncbi:iron(III) transport system substrate-binding protein [Actinobaculum suis]|uniref:ABC transporter substrate-binding protein n=1 Tax=Actinobaculum suis TaxID=1657 RepID=A0A1G7DR19_9ACTO|nr:ABC transporter substrate-binding protein [Actinobaculum suis]MDY5153564.1 ABC transporter substrate-binding protein [Actinobaculum suis]SDE53919.1 iron(III) transport system substrate-binding protein [Actinobaculum suis]